MRSSLNVHISSKGHSSYRDRSKLESPSQCVSNSHVAVSNQGAILKMAASKDTGTQVVETRLSIGHQKVNLSTYHVFIALFLLGYSCRLSYKLKPRLNFSAGVGNAPTLHFFDVQPQAKETRRCPPKMFI